MSIDLIHGVTDQHSRAALTLHNNPATSRVAYLYKWILSELQGKVKERKIELSIGSDYSVGLAVL